jgi:hypothetical protein
MRHQGLEQQHGGDIAHQVGENGREATQDVHAVELKVRSQRSQIFQQRGLLDPGYHDEEAKKQDQQGPVDGRLPERRAWRWTWVSKMVGWLIAVSQSAAARTRRGRGVLAEELRDLRPHLGAVREDRHVVAAVYGQ